MRKQSIRILLCSILGASLASGVLAQDDPLTLYSGRNEELIAPLIEQFTETTGIPVNVLYGDTAALANQILEEGENSPADVFLAQDAGALGALENLNMLTDLPESILIAVPDVFRSPLEQWVGISGRARVLVYNPAFVEELGLELPDSITDLTDPAYAGLVGWAPSNASFQANMTALRVLLGEEAASQWLADMVANGAVSFGSSNTNLNQAVASGEIPMGITNHYYMFRILAQDPEASIAQHFFPAGDPGSLINVAGAGILATSDQPEPALEFISYLLSPIAQQYFTTSTYEYPLVEGVIVNPALTPFASITQPDINLSDLADLQTTLEMIEASGALDE
jgi:iron(III) transport system substrate-binding protein